MILLGGSLLYFMIFMFTAYKSQVCRFTFKINCAVPILLFGISFAIIAYKTEPLSNAGWDLISHHYLIDQMREAGTMRVPFANSAYHTEFLTVLLHYLVSLLPSDNFFQFIAVMIEFIILSILLRKIQREEDMKGSELCLYFILIFSLCPIYQYVSGIRSVLATSFLWVAIYRDLYFKKKDIVAVMLYGAAVFFHTFSIIVVMFRLLFLLKRLLWKCRFLFLIWGIGIIPIISFFTKLGDMIPLFRGFSGLVRYYGRIGNISRIASNFTKYDFFRVIIVFLLLISSEIGRKYMYQNNRKGIQVIEFYVILCYFSMGSLAVYHLFDRMCIVIAWGSLLTLYYLFTIPGFWYYKVRNLIHFLLCVGCGILFLLNLRHMVVFSDLVVQ